MDSSRSWQRRFGWFDRNMKPGFALSLSAEGIVLLHRAAGGWRNVGRVPLDAPDLSAALEALKQQGERLEPQLRCKVIVPNDQIRYQSIETGDLDIAARRELARASLEGATPYAVDELAFDLSEEGGITHVAAVALETLQEAESFALENGFEPTSFVAVPGEMGFLGEPFFGPAASFAEGPVEPDGIAVVDIGPAEFPATNAASKADQQAAQNSQTAAPQDRAADTEDGPATDGDTDPDPVPDTVSDTVSDIDAAPLDLDEVKDAPIAGFSSRRRRSGTPPDAEEAHAPALQGVRRITPRALSTGETLPASEDQKTASTKAPAKAGGSQKQPSAGTKTPKAATPKPVAPEAPARAGSISAAATTASAKVPAAPAATPRGTSDELRAARTQNPANTAPAKKTPAAGASPSKRSPAQSQAAVQVIGGKPKHLGLILTVALVLFMAAVAAFAFLSPGLLPGGLFSSPDDISDSDPQTTPDLTESPTDTSQDADRDNNGQPGSGIAPQVSPLPDQPDPGLVELPEQIQPPHDTTDPTSSTDLAVLDALEGHPEEEISGADDPEAMEEHAEDDLLDFAARYAATGIWDRAPTLAGPPALVDLDEIYVASIDNSNLSQDAVALPSSIGLSADDHLDSQSSPAAAGNAFDLDGRGLVVATPEGTLNPDGVMVFLGRPAVVPPPTPARADPAAAAAEAEVARQQELARLRPRPRPGDLVERAERALLGGLSRDELAKRRPRPRPPGLKTEEQENQPVSDLAISTSVSPRARPTNFANLVDRATRQRNSETSSSAASGLASVAPVTVSPSIPSSASVARQATVNNAINLRRLNLIGVYGTPSNRSALVRLPSGRFKKVQVGDRIDGGRVVAISDTQLRYQKNGKNTTLKLPGG